MKIYIKYGINIEQLGELRDLFTNVSSELTLGGFKLNKSSKSRKYKRKYTKYKNKK
jgi:hypothetical protein